MSTDTFEDELRSLLHDTADAEGPAYVDVDPHAVVTQGSRVVRRRRMAAGAGIAAAAVTLGAVGVATLGDGVDRTSDPAVSTSVPTATGPVSVDLTTTAERRGREPRPDDPVESARASRWTADPDSGRSPSPAATGEPRRRPPATLPANPRFSTYAEVGPGPGLVVGVMPAAAKGIVADWLADLVESSYTSARLPGTRPAGLRDPVLSSARAPTSPGTSSSGASIWTDGEQVFDSAGAEVPSATASHDDVVFVDRARRPVRHLRRRHEPSPEPARRRS